MLPTVLLTSPMKRYGKMLVVEEKVFPDRLNDVDSQFKTVQAATSVVLPESGTTSRPHVVADSTTLSSKPSPRSSALICSGVGCVAQLFELLSQEGQTGYDARSHLSCLMTLFLLSRCTQGSHGRHQLVGEGAVQSCKFRSDLVFILLSEGLQGFRSDVSPARGPQPLEPRHPRQH